MRTYWRPKTRHCRVKRHSGWRPSGALLASHIARAWSYAGRLDGAHHEYSGTSRSRTGAAGRREAGRPRPRRHGPPAAGRSRLRDGRTHPADLHCVPAGRRRRGTARTRGHARQPLARSHHRGGARLQLLLASRQHRRGPASDPLHARAVGRWRAGAPRHNPEHAGVAQGGTRAARDIAGAVRHDPGQPGADRASDRSAAQERARPRDGGRAAARRPRSDAADAEGGRGRRQRSVTRDPDALADEPVAARPSDRRR